MTLRLENVSRLPTGLMLAEDTVPYALGTRPRYVLDRIERGGMRELSYPLRSDLRGKFEIGPLEIRIADSFGLVELAGRSPRAPPSWSRPGSSRSPGRDQQQPGPAKATAGPG